MNLPYSKNKYYLSGVDWLVNGLHYALDKQTGTGNYSQVVLELGGTPEAEDLRRRLRDFLVKYPLLRGRVARDWMNLAPYWRQERGAGGELELSVIDVEQNSRESQQLLPLLSLAVNKPFPGDLDHLRFTLFRLADGKSLLSLTFDHRLLDANGAESLLYLFSQQDAYAAAPPQEPRIAVTAEPQLYDWGKRREAGRRLRSWLADLAAKTNPRVLPLPVTSASGHFHYRLRTFSPEDSQSIQERAEREGGFLMVMPFLLAATAAVFHELFEKRGCAEPDYLVPVSIDGRKSRDALELTFFNHLSFLFLRLTAEDAAQPGKLTPKILSQMYEQQKAGLPDDLAEANLLMRIVPLPVLNALGRWLLKKHFGSFFFAYVGGTALPSETFLGLPVTNLYHMPRLPVPPGLGLLFNRFGARLNATLSYMDGLLTDDEADEIMDRLKTVLTEPQ